ncbi:MAG: hypothetical protein DVB28_001059 [Verrucomicrobia bacterium]|nr:MAG: hypothetical protein DVB28_001059 [Verrucomicrobiota bacterium]
MSDNALDTRQKALLVNLDPRLYGTFAEIGAGQEVVRWFFRVGGAAGTVAKSMSAYDMTVSDAIYGTSDRYVSRSRLEAMLSHEFELNVQRLDTKRGDHTCFFAFADTVAARSFRGGSECHGWMGITFQHAARAPQSRILIHVRMLDAENAAQAEALGVVGVNLVYGAGFLHQDPESLLTSLLDQLSVGRIEIDMVEFSGAAFSGVDNRLMSLKLVQLGLSGAAMFGPSGEVLQPSEVFYRKAILVERGAFHPVTKVHMDMLKRASEKFRASPEVKASNAPVLEVMEITMRNLLSDQKSVDPQDFLDRADVLAACGLTVLVSDFSEYYRLSAFLTRMTREPIGIALGVTRLLNLFEEGFYTDLPGGILESFGRLLKHQLKLFVYPALDKATGQIRNVDNLVVPAGQHKLFEYLNERGSFVGLETEHPSLLSIYPKDVLDAMLRRDPVWKSMVPAEVVEAIERKHLFMRASEANA